MAELPTDHQLTPDDLPDRRSFLVQGTVTVALAALGLSGCSNESGQHSDRADTAAPSSSTIPEAMPQTSPTTSPSISAEVPLAPLRGLARPYIGLAMGDRFEDLEGQPEAIDARMKLVAQYGNVARIDFARPGEKWDFHNDVMAAALRHKVGIIGMLGVRGLAPEAAKRYAQEVTDWYGFQNGQPMYWLECDNEVNNGTEADPVAYARQLVAVAQGIRDVNPNLPVITAGLSPGVDNDPNNPGFAPVTYSDLLLKALGPEGRALIKGWAWHPYDFDTDGETDPDSAWGQMSAQPNIHNNQRYTLADIFDHYGIPDMPVYMTESGTQTAAVGLERQRQDVERLLMRQVARLVTVMGLVHTLRDDPTLEDPYEREFGILTADLQEKPAATWMREQVAAAR